MMATYLPVRVSPDEDRHGRFYHTLPWSVLDFFDVGAFISHEKDHIDQDSLPALEEIISLTEKLSAYHLELRKIDLVTLKNIIRLLETIEREREPIKIFYPQIASRQAKSSFAKQREEEKRRIEAAQTEAERKARGYREQAAELLKTLTAKYSPGIGPSNQEVIDNVQAFSKLCEKAVYEQKGLLAKGMSVVSKQVMATIEKMREVYFPSKKREAAGGVIAGNHPLVELLVFLSDESFSSGVEKEAKIKDALPRLEQYHPSFQGMKQFVESRVPPPYRDLMGLRRALHLFLMQRFIPKMNPLEYMDDALLQVYSVACRLVGEPLPLHTSEKTEMEWAISGIRDPQPLTRHAIALVKADLAHEESLMALYHAAILAEDLNLWEKSPPRMTDTDATKLEWAARMINNGSLVDACRLETERAAETKQRRYGEHADAITVSTRIEKKVAWAKNHLRLCWTDQNGIDLNVDNQALKDAQQLFRLLREQIGGRGDFLKAIVERAIALHGSDRTPECRVTADSCPEEMEVWLKSLNLKPYRVHRDFVRLVMSARGEIKTPNETDLDLLDFYEQARKLGMGGIPDLRMEEGHKIAWAKRVIDGEIPCDNEGLQTLRGVIREDLHDQFIATLVHLHGRLRKDLTTEGVYTARCKIQWGQKQIQGCFRALFQPGDPSALKGAELVWMATAHYQQLQELDRIRVCVTRHEESPSVETILQNLNMVIRALEMQPDLIRVEQTEELTRLIVEPILDWITISHEFCRQEQHNAIQQKEVDELFEPIARDIRAKKYLGAFKSLKTLLERSPLATRRLLERTSHANLDQLGHAFNLFLQEKPPQKTSPIQGEILTALGLGADAPLTEDVLSRGVELQRKKMISNVLVLAGYKILDAIMKGILHSAFGWGEKAPGLAQSYKEYREAVDAIAGEHEDYDATRVRGAIVALATKGGYSLDSDEGRMLVQRLEESIGTTKARFAGKLETPEAKEMLHQKTYQGLLSVLITVNTKGHEAQSQVARLLLPLLLWVVDLFVDPFSYTLIERFTNDVILASNGQLTDLHVRPLEGLNAGFSTYNEKVTAWPDIAQGNARLDDRTPNQYRGVSGGEHQKDLAQLLDTPRTYPHGLTSSQIDQKGLYMCVDEYLNVAHLCQDVQGMFDHITEKLWEKSHEHPVINGLAFGVKALLSLLPYTYAWEYFLVLKMSEVMINFSLKQIAKFVIWYSQAGTNIMMKTLNTTVRSSRYTTALDKILLERFRDLERDLEKEVKLAKKEAKGAVSVNDKSIHALLSHIKTTLGTIQCDTPSDVRALQDALPAGLRTLEAFATSKVKDAVVPLIIRTFESFLNKESMLLALYRGLELANKGVREETDPLNETQMAELMREKRKRPDEITSDDIQEKIGRIHDGLKDEMAKTLKKILETAAHPMIDKAIDDLAKQPGQVVSETISWLEKVLYDESGNGESECILQKLSHQFARPDSEEHHDAALNQMYEDYSHFIKVFREHEDDLKRHQSYNGILLSRDVLNVIAEPLDALTMALAEVMREPRDLDKKRTLDEKLQEMKEAVGRNRPALNRVKDSETTSHAERHRGMMGRTLGSWEVLLSSLKEKAKPPVHKGLDKGVEFLADNGRKIPRNPVLMQHLARSLIAPYLTV